MADRALKDLVIISGFSGAGKSSAMNVFEDAGYFCVDNLPPEMIRSLTQLFLHPGSKVGHAAVVSDLRGGEYFDGLDGVLDELRAEGIDHRVIFLHADEGTLINRYKETRRRHPLAPKGSIVEGIKKEQALLSPIRARTDYLIDTTGLGANDLRRKLTADLLTEHNTQKLALTFLSFGYKHGPAREADLVFDVRFLPNPHYEEDLRPLTGHDASVAEYVARDGRLDEFIDRVTPLLDYLLPQYTEEGKAHLVVAIGCTGGRHRSVAVAEQLARAYRDNGSYVVQSQHRDIEKATRH